MMDSNTESKREPEDLYLHFPELNAYTIGLNNAANGRLINQMGLFLFVVLAVIVDPLYFWICLGPVAAVGAGYLADMTGRVWLAWGSILLTVLPYSSMIWLGVGT